MAIVRRMYVVPPEVTALGDAEAPLAASDGLAALDEPALLFDLLRDAEP